VSSSAGAPAARNGSGWYLYGIVAAAHAPAQLDAGISVDPAHGVELLTEGPLAALASKVSMEEFDEERLPERLNDPAWLERKIRAHEQVLERVLADASVVPFRFCTVYRSETELRRFLSERGDDLAGVLRRVDGKVELGVKAFVDRERFAAGLGTHSEEARELESRAAGAEGGRAYLEGRRLDQLIAKELERFAAEVVETSHAHLLAAADEGTLGPLRSPEVSGRSDEMLLNGAYLVPAGGGALEEAVAALARRYAEQGVSFEVTGPWPPYNFVPREVGSL
jgi:gas vesicle protein GvpL/GvpF